ncbi:MAG: chitobiase/beta-hexosaminidase C-terminal domain-containing protein [Dysgonamonadaceae bacterium]|jgi:exo-beta-1,3-glucanase (GH17 family)|nr:chitobiase/beta-hexosaminidase C-terminal domain-containing protein [Dysgonamonadaceae bacterium]
MKNLFLIIAMFATLMNFVAVTVAQAADPVVEINYIPPVGQGGIAEGRVIWEELTNENYQNYAVIAILRAHWEGGGDDYVKPSFENYLSEIDMLGNFFINITTNETDKPQPDYNFYFVLRSTFSSIDGSTIKSWNMAGRYLGTPANINRNTFWETKPKSPVPSVRPGFVQAGTSISISSPEAGSTIRFTIDGSDPKTSGTAQDYAGQTFVVPSSGSLLLKAVTRKGEEYSYPGNMTWIAYDKPNSDCMLFGLNVSLALNGEPFGYRLSQETTQARMCPIPYLTKWVRTFGTINNGLEYINAIAKEMNLHTLIGVYITNSIADNNAQLAGLRAILQAGPYPDMIAVGNECSLLGVEPKTLGSYIDSVRNVVKEKGVTIPIGSVDIGNASWSQYVLQKLDFRGVNLYPGTWDNTPQSQMFDQLKTSWNNELSNTPNLMVLLTETGTPFTGGSYSVAGGTQTASEEKAATYLENVIAWTKEDSIPCFYFEAYDELSKGEGIEQHFGLMNGNMQLHSFYQNILCPIDDCTTNTHITEITDNQQLFSNPIKDRIYLQTESKINIYNMQGYLLQKYTGKQIDLSNYLTGIYLIKVNNEMYKLMKQ